MASLTMSMTYACCFWGAATWARGAGRPGAAAIALLRAGGGFADQLVDGRLVGLDGLHQIAFLHQFLAGDDDARILRDAAKHQAMRRVVDEIDREERDLVVPADGADAEIALVAQRHHRAWQQHRIGWLGAEREL